MQHRCVSNETGSHFKSNRPEELYFKKKHRTHSLKKTKQNKLYIRLSRVEAFRVGEVVSSLEEAVLEQQSRQVSRCLHITVILIYSLGY